METRRDQKVKLAWVLREELGRIRTASKVKASQPAGCHEQDVEGWMWYVVGQDERHGGLETSQFAEALVPSLIS